MPAPKKKSDQQEEIIIVLPPLHGDWPSFIKLIEAQRHPLTKQALFKIVAKDGYYHIEPLDPKQAITLVILGNYTRGPDTGYSLGANEKDNSLRIAKTLENTAKQYSDKNNFKLTVLVGHNELNLLNRIHSLTPVMIETHLSHFFQAILGVSFVRATKRRENIDVSGIFLEGKDLIAWLCKRTELSEKDIEKYFGPWIYQGKPPFFAILSNANFGGINLQSLLANCIQANVKSGSYSDKLARIQKLLLSGELDPILQEETDHLEQQTVSNYQAYYTSQIHTFLDNAIQRIRDLSAKPKNADWKAFFNHLFYVLLNANKYHPDDKPSQFQALGASLNEGIDNTAATATADNPFQEPLSVSDLAHTAGRFLEAIPSFLSLLNKSSIFFERNNVLVMTNPPSAQGVFNVPQGLQLVPTHNPNILGYLEEYNYNLKQFIHSSVTISPEKGEVITLLTLPNTDENKEKAKLTEPTRYLMDITHDDPHTPFTKKAVSAPIKKALSDKSIRLMITSAENSQETLPPAILKQDLITNNNGPSPLTIATLQGPVPTEEAAPATSKGRTAAALLIVSKENDDTLSVYETKVNTALPLTESLEDQIQRITHPDISSSPRILDAYVAHWLGLQIRLNKHQDSGLIKEIIDTVTRENFEKNKALANFRHQILANPAEFVFSLIPHQLHDQMPDREPVMVCVACISHPRYTEQQLLVSMTLSVNTFTELRAVSDIRNPYENGNQEIMSTLQSLLIAMRETAKVSNQQTQGIQEMHQQIERLTQLTSEISAKQIKTTQATEKPQLTQEQAEREIDRLRANKFLLELLHPAATAEDEPDDNDDDDDHGQRMHQSRRLIDPRERTQQRDSSPGRTKSSHFGATKRKDPLEPDELEQGGAEEAALPAGARNRSPSPSSQTGTNQ